MRAVFAVIWLRQTLDALTFTLFHRVAPPEALIGVYERNPITAWMLATGGLLLVAAVKVVLGGLPYASFTGLIRWPDLGIERRVIRYMPAWLRRGHDRVRLYRLALRNIMLVVAGASGYVGMSFNLRAVVMVTT